MGYSSQAGDIAFRTQTAKGVYAADLETAGVGVRLRSGSITGSRELLVPDPEIGGNRDTQDALLGPGSFSGDLEFYTRFSSIGTFLKAALGTSATVTTTGLSTHTITPSDAAQLPFLSVYEQIGAGLERAQYTDCVVNTLHLEVSPDGYFMGTVGIIGARQVMGVADSDISAIIDQTTLTVGTNVKVLYDGTDIKPKSFALDINNNFEDNDYRLGSFYLEDLTPKQREVSGSMTLRHETSAIMRQALLGSATATAMGGLTTKKPIVVTFDTYLDIPGATPATKYSLSITIPSTVFEPFGFSPSGDDILEDDVNFRALRPTATPIMTAVLKNGTPAIA